MTDPDARVAALALEPCEFATWPGATRREFGPWRVFVTGGTNKRANSAFLVAGGEGAGDLAHALAALRQAGLAEVVRVSPAFGTADLVQCLVREGFEVASETLVMTRVAGRGGLGDGGGDVPPTASAPPAASSQWSATCDGAWLDAYSAWQGHGEASRGYARSIFEGCPSHYVSLHDERGELVGLGRVALADLRPEARTAASTVEPTAACVAVHAAVAVRADARGRGYGAALMHEMLSGAERLGATLHLLQVETDNARALGMYRQLGFEPAYEYRYYRRGVA
ncbi:GNAT family N-acetyltransferase [Micrococcales bacterium 31B]|nr:GNAT family N-acetyltransferase [Micrococcales bacterium 31B]